MGFKAGLYGVHCLSRPSLHCLNTQLETKATSKRKRLWVLGKASQHRPSGFGLVG